MLHDTILTLEQLLGDELIRISRLSESPLDSYALDVASDLLQLKSIDVSIQRHALSLIRREDFFALVHRYGQGRSCGAVCSPLKLAIYSGSAWRPVRPPHATPVPRHQDTRAEYPSAVEELLRTIRRVYTNGDKRFTQAELAHEIRMSKELGVMAPSLVRFCLRRIRVLHRFGKLSSLLGALRLLGAVIDNLRMNIVPLFPEIVAGLMSVIAGPNVLQSSTRVAQEYARRAAGSTLLRLLKRLGQPHSQAVLGRLAKELVNVASLSKDDIHVGGIRFFLEKAGLGLEEVQ